MSLRETPKTTHPSLQNQLHSKTTHRFTPNWSMVSMCFWVRFLDKCERKQTAFPSVIFFKSLSPSLAPPEGQIPQSSRHGEQVFVAPGWTVGVPLQGLNTTECWDVCIHWQVLLPKKQPVFPEQIWFFSKGCFFDSVYIYICICVCIKYIYIYIICIFFGTDSQKRSPLRP